jgi:plasmid maintenance system antidote protein VapI
MIHLGHVIKNKVEEQGKTTVWLAQELGCHRTNMYKIYEKRTIDTGVLLHISDILGSTLGIPADSIYVTFHPMKCTRWGWNGSIF